MKDNISYLHPEEKPTSRLIVSPGLVTLDGPDGAGKTTLAGYIAENLAGYLGQENVVLLSATNYILDGAGQSMDRLRAAKANVNGNSFRLDKIYCASTNRAYAEVIRPSLEAGKVVVVDRSEVDLVRYAMECGGDESYKLRRDYIHNGTITNGVWAGNRVFLTGNPHEIWENLQERGPKSKYDPNCLDDVQKRMHFQALAEAEIAQVAFAGSQNVVRAENKRVVDGRAREVHLRELSIQITAQLQLM